MVLVADADERAAHELRRELAVGGRQVDELAAGEALRRAALVHVDVRGLGADDGLEGPQHGGQRGDVAAGAVEDREGLDVAEELAHALLQRERPVVVAVGGREAVVGRGDRREHGGVHAGVVVAREEHQAALASRPVSHGLTRGPPVRRRAISASFFCSVR